MSTNYALTALGAAATASSTYSTNYPDRAIDGNEVTGWSSGTNKVGQWIKIDLSQSIEVGSIRMRQNASADYRATSYRVERSENNLDWYFVVDHAVEDEDDTFVITSSYGRYWRFTCLTGPSNIWSVLVIELVGDPYGGPYYPSCDYDEILRDVWDQTGIADKSSVLAAYGIPYLAGTGSIYNYLAFIICLLYNTYEQTQGGTLECPNTDPDNQAVFDRVVAAESYIDQAIDDQTVIINNEYSAIIGLDARSLTDVYNRVALAETNILNAISALQITLMGVGRRDLSEVFDYIGSSASAISVNDNANTAAIRGDPATDLRSLTTTMTTSFSTQTDELRGVSDLDHTDLGTSVQNVKDVADDILTAVLALPSNSGALRLWPGNAGVTYGAPTVVTEPTEINAVCHGVVVTVNSYPAGQSRMPAGTATRFKGIGWLAFRTDIGDYEALEQIQFAEAVILTRQLEQAAGMAVYCKPGAQLTVTPFTIDAL